MDREILYKLIRVAIFPFRFVYLIVYQWRMEPGPGCLSGGPGPRAPAGPDASPPRASEEIGDGR